MENGYASPVRPHRIARQHVRTDRLLGVEAVPFSPPSPAAPARSASAAPAAATPARAPVNPPSPRAAAGGVPSMSSPPRPTPAPAPPAAPVPAAGKPLSRERKIEVLGAMDEGEVRACTRCELCKSRMNTVFGEGDPDAAIMFIGEGPGQSEDEEGRPFVGRSGELLTNMIQAMGVRREQVYIANVVKCRPPNNRTPTPAETTQCWDYLRRQIETIRPRVIVTVGGPATKTLLNTKEGITRLRGTWHAYDGINPAIPVMPTFHPAYLLRSYTRENRQRVWSDLQQVMTKVGSSG